eukprot:gene34396-42421_t
MIATTVTWTKRLALSTFVFILASTAALVWLADLDETAGAQLTDGDVMTRVFAMPALAALAALTLLTACAVQPVVKPTTPSTDDSQPTLPYLAQVVGVQWLNPLQRRDYSTEWQLLWTLGLVQPNKDDDMVRANQKKYSALQIIGPVASGNDGKETFTGYYHKYLEKFLYYQRHLYFTNPRYFYNAHSRDKKAWRELAGIRVECALPKDKLDPVEASNYLKKEIKSFFDIGHPSFPNAWTRDTPPDVRVTMGGPNAGFTSLVAALDYLQAHPNETVWAMNWDAPSRPKDEQLNENLVLLVLAGPGFKTERAALAWIGYPAVKSVADFEAKDGLPSSTAQAWQATLSDATRNGRKQNADIGYVIHDANNRHADSPQRLGNLAQTLTTEVPNLDFVSRTFNTSALLGEMGAGSALTNVALAIAYANHMGKNVLVTGTTDAEHPTALLVTPPETVRPINHEARWFRARGENHAYLMWWGIRHGETVRTQGFSD